MTGHETQLPMQQRSRQLVLLVVFIGITLLANLGVLGLRIAIGSIGAVPEASLVELSMSSRSILPYEVLVAGIRDFYDVEQLTITPEAWEQVRFAESHVLYITGAEQLSVEPFTPPETWEAGNVYTVRGVDVEFVPHDGSHVLVFLDGENLVVVGDNS